jgi:hypothetical protein
MKTALRLTLAAFGLATFNLSAATLLVSLESTNPVAPFATWETAAHVIQDAVDAAQAWDTVLVTNGVYSVGERTTTNQLGEVEINRVVVTNSISLQSVSGPVATTIDGGGSMRCVYLGTNAVLSGFTVTAGGVRMWGGGVFCDSSGLVTNCALTGNRANVGGGAYGGTLYDCTLTGNSTGGPTIGGIGGGAFGSTLHRCTLTGNYSGDGAGASDCTLYSCTLTGNGADYGPGAASRSTLYNCTLADNTGRGQIMADGAFHNCTLTHNYGGISGTAWNCIVYSNTFRNYAEGTVLNYCLTSPLPTNGIGNIDADPRFVNAAAGDYHLRPDSPCIDAGTNLASLIQTDIEGQFRPQDGNKDGVAAFDIGAYEFRPSPMTLHVSLESTNPVPPYITWATAAKVIQDAVDVAKDGDTVLVTNGVYAVGSREQADLGPSRVVVTNAIRLESVNGPLVTTIDGGGSVRCVYLDDNAVLSRFTLTNGAAGGAARNEVKRSGGVVPMGGCADCPPPPGGGAYGGTLYDCTLAGNSAPFGGGACLGSLCNCTLTYNSASEWGGGASGSTLYNCTLTRNSGLFGGGACSSTLYNCLLTGNSALFGGGACGQPSNDCTLYNCLLIGNSAGQGGGAYASTLYSCTVTSNHASEDFDPRFPGQGGGVFGGTLYNSIVYYNTAVTGANYFTDSAIYMAVGVLNYCSTTPLPSNGVGNITGPPLFMDMAAGDFRLREDSPCIDAGTNLLGVVGDSWGNPVPYSHDPTDILGNSRFIDGNGDGKVAWDIGAYEFNPASMQLVDIPDTGLLAAIRVALSKPTGDLTVGDVERLTVLDASRQARGPDAPLILSLEGLQAARNLTQLNLSGGGAGSPNIAVSDFSPLAGLTHLTTLSLESNQLTSLSLPAGLRVLRELHLRSNQLTGLTLPEGLASLRYLDVRDNPITYLAVPESMDLSQLVLEGFSIDHVARVMLRIGPACVGSDGAISLPVSGPAGQAVRVQRSTNLVHWEDWQTVTLDGNVKQLLDDPAATELRFYRAIVDTPAAVLPHEP